jgi:hypothetical protein
MHRGFGEERTALGADRSESLLRNVPAFVCHPTGRDGESLQRGAGADSSFLNTPSGSKWFISNWNTPCSKRRTASLRVGRYARRGITDRQMARRVFQAANGRMSFVTWNVRRSNRDPAGTARARPSRHGPDATTEPPRPGRHDRAATARTPERAAAGPHLPASPSRNTSPARCRSRRRPRQTVTRAGP